ncbi:MAG TPA: cyclic nucleotide-binding domain-containing protein [Thermoanaerobaculia bacterium]|nr:cyclic nucleotide-binding domain-containing protein [Thermoanaerobaculia bacterium]
MPPPDDFRTRIRNAARAAEGSGLTAEADDLLRLAFEVDEAVAPRAFANRVFFEIAEIGAPKRARKGERLWAAGSPSRDFLLVVEGRIGAERVTPMGPQSLGDAGPGDFAGAADALLAIPRLGEATALEDSRFFVVPSAEFFGGAPSPEVSDYLLRRLARRLRSLNDEFGKFFPEDKGKGPIGGPAIPEPADVPDEEKSKTFAQVGLAIADADLLASHAREAAYPQGAVIFREGDEGHDLSVVARGKVRISRRISGAGEEAFAILDVGAIFGEMAVFDTDSPVRSADAIAHTECTLLTLEREVIENLRRDAPEKAAALTAALCRLAARRIAETSERLVRWRMMAGMF